MFIPKWVVIIAAMALVVVGMHLIGALFNASRNNAGGIVGFILAVLGLITYGLFQWSVAAGIVMLVITTIIGTLMYLGVTNKL